MDFHSVLVALGGGLLIGLAATVFLLFNGRIAGISNIVAGLWTLKSEELGWRCCFVFGLLAGGWTLLIFLPEAFGEPTSDSLVVLVFSGFVVGFGARMANGCTSGHGVCGLSRRSLRSLVATVTFVLTGMVTVFVVNHALV